MLQERKYESKKISFSFVVAIILFVATLHSPLTSVGPATTFTHDALNIS